MSNSPTSSYSDNGNQGQRGNTNWQLHWKTQKQPWRTEPEIRDDRKHYLTKLIESASKRETYPFKDVELNRADIEWLVSRGKGLRLHGVNLCGIDLSKLPLKGVDLSDAHLEGANLSNAYLEEANLSNAHLERSSLSKASLTRANLSDTYMEEAVLSKAHLLGASLKDAHLRKTILSEVNLQDADLSKANLEDADLSEAHLERANLKGAFLKGVNLSGAFLERPNLKEANLYGANLSSARLQSANFNDADLRYANLDGVYLKGANLRRVHLEGASLKGANLRETWLEGAYLEKAQIDEVSLKGAKLEKAHLEGASLAKAHLERANLTRVRLEGASLVNAHLEGASLGEAHLEGTNLMEAHLEGVNLAGAFFDNATNLQSVTLGNKILGFVSLAGVHWNDADLSVVDWTQVKVLGDETPRQEIVGKMEPMPTRLITYRVAVRANRQLAVALQGQGLNEEAAHFAYRAQQLQRKVLWLQKKFGQYFFSLFLDTLAGYGYKPIFTLIWYLSVIVSFAFGYYMFTHFLNAQPYPLAWHESLILSISSFHGRGFFQPVRSLGDPVAILASVEAIVGLLIEVSFIATFTQRFFGK